MSKDRQVGDLVRANVRSNMCVVAKITKATVRDGVALYSVAFDGIQGCNLPECLISDVCINCDVTNGGRK